ncbi:type VI secretion protein IcmF/TssM N-terminal domain-containing protein [Luteibacter sp. PPL552]
MNPWDDLRRHRWIRAAAIFVACAAALAVAGEYVGIGPYRPLASRWARALAIVVLAVGWIAAIAWQRRLGRGDEHSDPVRALRARFVRGLASLRRRRATDRPWYVVIGPAGSGKSDWLASAGFDRLLVPWSALADDASRVWPSCDWWTDGYAVALEADGHHLDGCGAWQALLAWLRRHGRRRLAGIVVALAMPDPGAEVDEATVRKLRGRLDDALAVLGRLPVYLLVTHADRMSGFTDAFERMDARDRRQVWGVTFADPGHAEELVATRLARQFDALAARFEAQVSRRWRSLPDIAARLRVFGFGQQVRWHGDAIAAHADLLFARRGHRRMPMLRGVYFTSSAQAGETHDAADAGLDAHFGLRRHPATPRLPRRRAYFGQALMSAVMLPEAGLAQGHADAWRRRLGVACLAALACGIVAAGLQCHTRQTRLVAHVMTVLDDLPDVARAPTSLRDYYMRSLRRIDVLSRVERTLRAASPGIAGMGLGDTGLDDVLDAALRREFVEGVFPGVAAQWRDDMRSRDPRRLYLALKGHLMLAYPSRRHGEGLRRLARSAWQVAFDDERLASALDDHLAAFFERRDALPAFAEDRPLVESARASLRTVDVATLAYAELVLGPASQAGGAIRLDRSLGMFSHVFRRKSGEPLSTPLSPLYSRQAFVRMMGDDSDEGDLARAASRFAADAWMLGEDAGATVDRATIEARLRTLYVADYLTAWDTWLADLEWTPDATAVTVTRLGGPASPLKALLMLLRHHTQGLGDAVGSAGRPGAARIADHFGPLTTLVEGDVGQTPFDRLRLALDAAGGALLATTEVPPSVLDALRVEAARLPPPLSSWIETLAGAGSAVAGHRAGDALEASLRGALGGDCAKLTGDRYPFVPQAAMEVPLRDFAALFGPGTPMDVYLRERLPMLVDMSRPVWRYRNPTIDTGAQVLAIARAAAGIRDTWFQEGASPTVAFTLSVPELPPGIGQVRIEVDGQLYERSVGRPDVVARMRWPGPVPGRTTIRAWDAEGQPLPTLDYAGEWSWFRALDAARLERRTDTRYEASFEPGGRTLRVAIEASSLRHPFGGTDVHRFRCPS